MTGADLGKRLLSATLWLGAALGAGIGCDAPASPMSTAGRPLFVPDPSPVVSQCESSTILAGAPRPVADPAWEGYQCTEAYEVDFIVEARPADTMVLDMFQSRPLWNWRVEASGDTVRHEFSLRIVPRWNGGTSWRRGVRPAEPIVLQRCPEGEGDGEVLACTTTRCGIYDDVSQVPPLEPAKLQVAISAPVDQWYRRHIREGETVEVPFTVQMFNPLAGEIRVVFELSMDPVSAEFADVDISPPEIRLPAGSFRTRTVPLRVTLTRYDYHAHRREEPTVPNNPPEFFLWVIRDSDRSACSMITVRRIGFRLLPPG